MTANRRLLPVGIQSFKEIRERGYLYVDKSDTVWHLANEGKKYNYLRRPRRFGKSVLVDTLQCYFEGRRDMFEGLKIMELEKEWTARPVIRLDMSRGGASEESLRSYFDSVFSTYEEKYRIVPRPGASLSVRFDAIIVAAYKQTGQQWPYSSTSMTRRFSTRGKRPTMRPAREPTARCSPY